MRILPLLATVPLVTCDMNWTIPLMSLSVVQYDSKTDAEGRETMYIWAVPVMPKLEPPPGPVMVLADMDKDVADHFCITDRWHVWVTVVSNTTSLDQETEDKLHWVPSWCKKDGRVPTTLDIEISEMPRLLVPDSVFDKYKKMEDAGEEYYVLFKSDLFSYENKTELKSVCKPGHDFLGGVIPLRDNPTEPWERIEQFFVNKFDPCVLIRHPCWCARAPQQWNCAHCRLDDLFGRASLCYQAGSEAGKWCTAVTYQGFPEYDKPNRPIDAEEYQYMLEHRDDYKDQGIYWLDEAGDDTPTN
ncbi:hypothetical protein GNI_155710 [Gregarina niphandrodes]|uniref:Transmembrane protein n=1 Tax=Gregarina niphandrodes TaxID=110365 RepID=A0A023AZ52_GRENI|nr:hypothetical protein GNI_155710 [Gregarina niphandrodes]EZG43929.1 hypothetical protein GNI_155710 [Gregarina niphandrodes]|eukprot:XP_011132900.1 hypothetical protein GNI_155710 [Gregarina niphandrodes]